MKLRKALSAALVFAMLIPSPLTAVPAGAVEFKSEKLNRMAVSKAVDLGYPLTNTQLIDCTFGVEDGKNMVYTTATGKPAVFVCYNLDDRKIERSFVLPGAKNSWAHGTDSKGNVYVATQAQGIVCRYDPVTKEFKNLGKIYSAAGVEQNSLYGVAFDKEDNPYFGTYPDALIVRYNIKTEKMEIVTDKLLPGMEHVRALAINGDYLYGGATGTYQNFARVNLTTKEVEQLPQFTMPDGDRACIIQGITPCGDYIFCNLLTDKKLSVMAAYKVSEGRWLDKPEQIIQTNGFYTSQPLDGKVYVHNQENGKLSAFDLATETYEDTDMPGATNRTSKFIQFETEELPGYTMVTVQSNGNVSLNNFEKKTYEEIPTNAAPQPIEIRCMEPGLKGTNTVMLSSYMGPKLGIMDDTSHHIDYLPAFQVEGMGESNGNYYTGEYPGAYIYKVNFDTMTKEEIGVLSGEKQDRPFQVISAGEGLTAISSMPDYGELGGALTLYHEQENELEILRGIVKDQNIVGLAYRDGKIYGTTSIWGGLGAEPTTTDAQVFCFDIATKKVEKVKPIRLKSLNTATMFAGEIQFGADGNLWAVSKGVVFSVNPDTLEVTDEIAIKPQDYDVAYMTASPYSIEWVDEDIMITNSGYVLSAVDIKTKEFRLLYDEPMQYMTVSEGGNIYFSSSNRVKLYKMGLSMEGDPNIRLDLGGVQNGMEQVPYGSFGFSDSGFITEKNGTLGTVKTKVLTFHNISNDSSFTSSVTFGVKGKYNGADLTKYPQNISLSQKDGKNTICIQIPHQSIQTILPLPAVKMNDQFKAGDAYQFRAKVFVTPAESVDSASKISLDPNMPKVYGNTNMGAYVRFFDEKGEMIENSDRAYVTASDKWQDLVINLPQGSIPPNTDYMVAYMYYSNGNATYETHIAEPAFYHEVAEADRGADFNQSVILRLDRSTAYVNLFRTQIDKDNAEVKPYTKDDRTLVPIRFIAESFGAQVGWDEATQTVSVSYEGTEVKIILGEKQMLVNGKIKEMDVAAITENDRTMLPLRAVSEALGKQVFWDDRGLIIITDQAVDSQRDKEQIEKIISVMK